MLEQHEQTRPIGGATAEELAAALASLHARQGADRNDVSGEQLTAEIRAQRERWREKAAHRSYDSAATLEAWQNFWKNVWIGGGIVVGLIVFAYIVSAGNRPVSRPSRERMLRPVVYYSSPPLMTNGNATQPFLPYNSAYQQHYPTPADTMDAEFYRKLALSTGPNPIYKIVRVPLAGTFQTTYPIRAIPDGYTIAEENVDNVKFYQKTPVVLFQNAQEQHYQSARTLWLLTRYNGRFYRRAWIRPQDIPALKKGHAVFLSPSSDDGSGEPLRPLTLAEGNYPTNAYQGPLHYAYASCYQDHRGRPALLLPEGKKVTLDSHAWEDFPRMTPPQYQPPAWSRHPGVFSNIYGGQDQDACSPAFDASAVVRPFSEVPEGRPVFCNFYTVRELILNRPFTSLQVDTRPSLYVSTDSDEKRQKSWQVVKIGGAAYLRAWIMQRITQPELAGRAITVFPGPHSTEFLGKPVQITLRLSNFRTTGTANSKMLINNVLLDKHAWDNN